MSKGSSHLIKKYEAGHETYTYENKPSQNVAMPMSKPQHHSANGSEQAIQPSSDARLFILS